MKKLEYAGRVVDFDGGVIFQDVDGILFHRVARGESPEHWTGAFRVCSTEPVAHFVGRIELEGVAVQMHSTGIEGRTLYVAGCRQAATAYA